MISDTVSRTRLTGMEKVLSLVCALLAVMPWLWFYHHPLLIYAGGYAKSHWMEPLQQMGDLQIALGYPAPYFALKWDGEMLYLGVARVLVKSSYAPEGAFSVAALPHGVGFALGGSKNGRIDPVVVPYVFLGAWLIPTWVIGRTVIRKRRSDVWVQQGRCGECGYNLTGNVSGICPECGGGI